MTKLGSRDRLSLAAQRARRMRDGVLTGLDRLPIFGRRHGSSRADQLLILPQDLRPADPSFAAEMADGQVGLASGFAPVAGGAVFAATAPSAAFERELHGFGWLRDLHVAATESARKEARSLVAQWITAHRPPRAIPWEAAVVARRIISWITHAAFLLEEAEPDAYARVTDSLGEQVVHLAGHWRSAPEGYPRLLTLIALVLADLCVAGHDRSLERAERHLSRELGRQIFADGGHLTRGPHVLIELMLDLLPLRQCFIARMRPVPPALEDAIARMLEMLQLLRHRDGALARFNGMGGASLEPLATIFAYGEPAPRASALAPQSRYARLARGTTTILVDAGGPPALAHAADTHAGCLSLEMSSGTHCLIVNAGAPLPCHTSWRNICRATLSHSTVTINDQSSGRLATAQRIEQQIGAPPMRLPRRVSALLETVPEGDRLTTSHDGYLRPFRLLHRRTLTLSPDGRSVTGLDELTPSRGILRLARDLPFAIRFHLHPAVTCLAGSEPGTVDLVAPSGPSWRMSVERLGLSIEESQYLAGPLVPQRALQIVIRGSCGGESRIPWRFRQVD